MGALARRVADTSDDLIPTFQQEPAAPVDAPLQLCVPPLAGVRLDVTLAHRSLGQQVKRVRVAQRSVAYDWPGGHR